MDGISGICRRYNWWLCLFCFAVFVSSADAATRRYPPNLPTAQQVGTGGVPTTTTPTTYNIEMEGVDYIPGDTSSGSKGTKMPVKSEVPFVKQRTWNMAKAGMRGGIVGIGTSIAVGMMLDQIGAFIDENSKLPMKLGKDFATSHDLYWCTSSAANYCDGSSLVKQKFATPADFYIAYQQLNPSIEFCSFTVAPATETTVTYTVKNAGSKTDSFYCPQTAGSTTGTLFRRGSCTSPYYYDPEFMACVKDGSPVPLQESDYALMEAFANAQNSAWLQGLLKDVCSSSPSPGRCFEDMQAEGRQLKGASSVAGPSKTTTSTYTDANGVTQQTTTTQITTYNIIKFGPNYYDYSKTVTTTKTGSDGSSETSTETETPEVTEEEKPPEEEQEEEQVAAQPCSGTTCDGPAYEDQYQPTEETKEDHIDSYVDRVASIPIIQAVGNLFDISAGGSCPVWTFNHQLEIGGFSTNINLVFDYLCQPWFTQYGPWIRAVIYLVAVYAAIRVALL
jgi:hypothetical protein